MSKRSCAAMVMTSAGISSVWVSLTATAQGVHPVELLSLDQDLRPRREPPNARVLGQEGQVVLVERLERRHRAEREHAVAHAVGRGFNQHG